MADKCIARDLFPLLFPQRRDQGGVSGSDRPRRVFPSQPKVLQRIQIHFEKRRFCARVRLAAGRSHLPRGDGRADLRKPRQSQGRTPKTPARRRFDASHGRIATSRDGATVHLTVCVGCFLAVSRRNDKSFDYSIDSMAKRSFSS